ncbi:IMP 5'-nucleotidase, partial [Chytridiales sp. JEL 0842]
AHKRDAFIEFIKSLLLTPFILHTRPRSSRPTSTSLSARDAKNPEDLQQIFSTSPPLRRSVPDISVLSMGLGNTELNPPDLQRTLTLNSVGAVDLPSTTTSKDENLERYCEVLDAVEALIVDHILHQNSGLPELSRLSQLVPGIGRFFTPLPLRKSFIENDKYRSIASRRYVPPSFNDIRHVLNLAQVMAIAPSVKLITFDGDMTLYADGADFNRDSELVDLLVGLLKRDIHVAIVTAAGYANDAPKYEQRLSGLLEGIHDATHLSPLQKSRFWVLGGECNYLFRYAPEEDKLVYIPEETYQPAHVRAWSTNTTKMQELLDVGEGCMREVMEEMGVQDRVKIIRKERAV